MDKHAYSLRQYNSFKIEASAQQVVEIHTREQLLRIYHEGGFQKPFYVLGEGTNLLFTCDFQGTIFVNRLKGKQVWQDEHAWYFQVSSGENWHELVAWTLGNNQPGLENLALIPGSVGAAPVQNIGAYGVEFASFCQHVDVLDLQTGTQHRLACSECQFGYRSSRFKKDWQSRFYILAVGLKLPKNWKPTQDYGPLQDLHVSCARTLFDKVCQVRQAKLPDPKKLGNAGSFFKNPHVDMQHYLQLKQQHPALVAFANENDTQVKVAAAWLIEQCGFKGVHSGGTGVYQHQSLVLVNHGQANMKDFKKLASEIYYRVLATFDIHLDTEVRLIGATEEITFYVWRET